MSSDVHTWMGLLYRDDLFKSGRWLQSAQEHWLAGSRYGFTWMIAKEGKPRDDVQYGGVSVEYGYLHQASDMHLLQERLCTARFFTTSSSISAKDICKIHTSLQADLTPRARARLRNLLPPFRSCPLRPLLWKVYRRHVGSMAILPHPTIKAVVSTRSKSVDIR